MDPDILDLDSIYHAREQERTHQEFEAIFGPVAIDMSDESLEESAAGGRQMERATGPRPPLESSSEAVRTKAAAEATMQPPLAAEALSRLLGFKDATEAREKLAKGELGVGGALKMTDIMGNLGEALTRERAASMGLPPDLAEKIAAGGGLASILFPMPGKAGKVAGAMKAGERAMAGATPSRLVGMTEDVKTVIGKIGKFNATRMEQGVVSHAETIRKAEAAMSLEEALTFNPEKFDLPTLRAAVAGHFAAASTYFTDLARRVAAGDATAVNEYWTAFAITADLAQKDALLGTQLGRGLEASKIALTELRAPFAPQEMQTMAELLAGAPEAGIDAATHARRMLMLPTSQRKTVMGQSIGLLKHGQNALYELWINALLSGPQTHAANILSNSLTAAWAPGERFLSALASAGESVVTLGAHDRTVFFGESAAQLHGALEGFKDGLRMAAKVLREGTAAGPQKLERAPAITAKAMGVRPEGTLGSAIDLLGAGIRTPGRLLMTEDAFFKAVNYRMELRALAYREAAQEGLSGEALTRRMRHILDHADEFPTVKTRADQFALVETFNRDLSDLGRLGQMGQGLMTFADAAPMGRIVLPFIRTPTNILHYASERTPVLNLISDTWRADVAAGGERRALALGKIGGGAMVAAVIASYAGAYIDPESPTQYMTVITGAGPKNLALRATLERQGWKPFSIWNPITRSYVSYNRLDPFGMTFGTVASAVEIMGQIPEAGVLELTMASAVAVSRSMLSKTYMEGLSTFLDSMEGKPEDITRFFQGLARTGVPTGIRQTTRVLDPLKREMDSLFDHWRSGLPGYDGPPAVNLWGEEIVFSGGLGPDLVSPIYASPYKPDDVDQWLANNRVALSRTPKVVAGTPPPGIQLDPATGAEGIRLEKEEISRLGVLIGKGGDAPPRDIDLGPLDGQPPLKDLVRSIIQGPGTNGPLGSRADMVRAAHNSRRRMAIEQLRRESPMLDEAMTQKLEERIKRKLPDAGGSPMETILKSLTP